MAHMIRPISTQMAAGGWVPVGAPTLWEAVDEVTPDDTDYAQVTGNGQVWILRFSPGTDHGVHTGHILRWRWRRHATAIRINVDIYQDDGFLFHIGVPAFPPLVMFYLYEVHFSAVQAGLITNYATLGLKLQSDNFNPTNFGDFSWIELELPGAHLTIPTVRADPATEVG